MQADLRRKRLELEAGQTDSKVWPRFALRTREAVRGRSLGGPPARESRRRARAFVAAFCSADFLQSSLNGTASCTVLVPAQAEKQNVEVQMRHELCCSLMHRLLPSDMQTSLKQPKQLHRVRTIILSCFGGRSFTLTSRTPTTKRLSGQPSCLLSVRAQLIRGVW